MARQGSSGTAVYRPVKLDRAGLAAAAFGRFRKEFPALFKEASAYQLSRAEEDLGDHIDALQESLATGRPALFIDYVRRACIFFISRHLPPRYVPDGLRVLREVAKESLAGDLRDSADKILGKGIAEANGVPAALPSCIDDAEPLAAVARTYIEALIGADSKKAEKIIADAAASGVPVKDIYLHVFVPVLQETGRRWLIQELSVAEEHYITASVGALITRLHDRFIADNRRRAQRGKTVVVASVERDLHEIGIRMVADFFEMDRWDTYYIGPNTPALSLLRAARDRKADVIAISCTMPSFLPAVHYLIRSLRADSGTAQAKIIVGGHPFRVDPGLWKQLGADACAKDAADAVAAAHRLAG
ncbi:MAG: cobalamin-dependent protein [Methanoregula sp.]|uniref:cobalamin B12-binding domain-containing protein n=1 Tax=Methanoregula sp. TaxID=2052170 RepID=UPI003BAFD029